MTERARSAWQGIEVRHLAALQALAEEASFHRAAHRLGYSQPAVSQQIAALERIVGTQLVNRPRISQPLTLTDAGKRLLVHAEAIQTSLAIAEAELGAAPESRQLRVGIYQTVAVHLLPLVLREIARTAPAIEIILTDRPGDKALVTLLERGELDFAFACLPCTGQRELKTEALAIDEYVLLVPRTSPLALRGTTVALGELGRQKLIGFKTSNSTHRVVAHLRRQSIELQFALRSDDNTVVQGFVAAGFGAALIPQLAAELLAGDFAILNFDAPLPPRVIGLAWTRDLSTDAAAATFLATTRDVVSRIWPDRLAAPDTFTREQRRTA